MKKTQYLIILGFLLLLGSCSNHEFQIYSDTEYARLVENEFARKKDLAGNRNDQLFGVFNDDLTTNEVQGLKFLYAFMPLNDLADYDGEFFLKQVRASLAARDTFHWGTTIPEAEFRHFVLPYRINNENLDTARLVFFDALKDRIRDMDMLDAALEVNHWCHEKVSYKSTDDRTSAPLAAVKTAYGRCGEESTFAVTALRSVAIPARQVYTPRWAHSDDNHAWVEFWANGKWHFMGACEPETAPNIGWFTEPARRAMLVHTKAYGHYQGSERVGNAERQYSLLNTLAVYAEVKEIFVKVVNEDGLSVPNASVEFQLYNYAEFYPISTKKADDDGLCSFLTGLGDLQVWAYKDDMFNYQKVSVAELDTLVLKLNQHPYTHKVDIFDLYPPIQREPFKVSAEGKELNALRLKKEDSIRGAYVATFMPEAQAVSLANELNVDAVELSHFISLSRGNYAEIEAFIRKVPEPDRSLAMKLLELVSKKDLRDTKASILLDHLNGAKNFAVSDDYSEEIFLNYILNPRVVREMLVDYRHYLQDAFAQDDMTAISKSPDKIVSWIKDNIAINSEENYYHTSITPKGVYDLRIADKRSVKIFAVAVLRSLAYPARLEAGTDNLQYWKNNDWVTFYFDKQKGESLSRCTLRLTNDPANVLAPKYHIHFSLAKFDKGKYHTLNYDWDKPLADFYDGVELDAGYYMLVTGNRQAGGSVLHSQEFFELKKGQTLTKVVSLRSDNRAKEVLATIDMSVNYQTPEGKDVSLQTISKQGWQVIAWIEPDKEPTKHTFQDLPQLKNELEALNVPFTFIIPESKLTDSFKNSEYTGLPENHQFLVAKDLALVRSIEKQTNEKLADHLPVFIIANAKGELIYLSSGYKIGIGEEIVKVIR